MSNLQFPLFLVMTNWGEPYGITTELETAEFICEDLDEIELAERAGLSKLDEGWDEPISRASIQRVKSEKEFNSLIGESSYALIHSLQTRGVYVL